MLNLDDQPHNLEDEKSEDDPEDYVDENNTLQFSQRLGLYNRNEKQSSNLRHLVNYIHGDLYHCAICSSKFEEPNNLPRVLFCGDCLCEKCISQSIMPISVIDKVKNLNAAKQIKCLVCNITHIFKMTKNGFIICNDNFVKVRDDQGLVNYIGQ